MHTHTEKLIQLHTMIFISFLELDEKPHLSKMVNRLNGKQQYAKLYSVSLFERCVQCVLIISMN